MRVAATLAQMDSLAYEPVRLTADDGYELGGRLFRGGSDTGDTALIVAGATAVPGRFYERFAAATARRGWNVLTFDLRGIGDSRPESLRGFGATIQDWAIRDVPAAVRWAQRTLRPRRLLYIGHSFGGQVLGLLPADLPVDRAVFVSSQTGYWRAMPGMEVWKVGLQVSVLLPWISRVVGYFPWSRLGAGEDLPRDVAIGWARWCRSPGYLLDDPSLPTERYARCDTPILAYSIDDDVWGSRGAVDRMMRAYPRVERRHLVPAERGIGKLGHMGYFRERAEPLWSEAYAWLDASNGELDGR